MTAFDNKQVSFSFQSRFKVASKNERNKFYHVEISGLALSESERKATHVNDPTWYPFQRQANPLWDRSFRGLLLYLCPRLQVKAFGGRNAPRGDIDWGNVYRGIFHAPADSDTHVVYFAFIPWRGGKIPSVLFRIVMGLDRIGNLGSCAGTEAQAYDTLLMFCVPSTLWVFELGWRENVAKNRPPSRW